MGSKIVYSKHLGIELELNGCNHLLLKEDEIVGILNNDDAKDLKFLNDRVLINIAKVKEKTVGGLLLTKATKEKPYIQKAASLIQLIVSRRPKTIKLLTWWWLAK